MNGARVTCFAGEKATPQHVQLGTKHMAPPGGATSKRLDSVPSNVGPILPWFFSFFKFSNLQIFYFGRVMEMGFYSRPIGCLLPNFFLMRSAGRAQKLLPKILICRSRQVQRNTQTAFCRAFNSSFRVTMWNMFLVSRTTMPSWPISVALGDSTTFSRAPW